MTKTLPLQDLEIVGLCEFIGLEEDPDTGREIVVTELDILNQELYDKLTFDGSAKVCSCCGHRIKHVCVVAHKPTCTGYYLGCKCARNIQTLQQSMNVVQNRGLGLAQRAECTRRQREYLKAHPDAAQLIEYSKNEFAPRICREMVEKIRRWGNISDKQLALWHKVTAEDKERRQSAKGTFPTGRQTVACTIVSTKDVPNDYARGRWDDQYTTKMTVDLGDGMRAYGTMPRTLEAEKGDKITLTAAFKPSPRDPLFGTFSRPSVKGHTKPTTAPAAPAAPAALDTKAIVEANPVLAEPDFQSKVERWNALNAQAQSMGLSVEEAAKFVAAGMKLSAEEVTEINCAATQ